MAEWQFEAGLLYKIKSDDHSGNEQNRKAGHKDKISYCFIFFTKLVIAAPQRQE